MTLEGAKEIATALERAWGVRCVSLDRVRRYMARGQADPVPYWTVMGRVYADSNEVALWAARQMIYKRTPSQLLK